MQLSARFSLRSMVILAIAAIATIAYAGNFERLRSTFVSKNAKLVTKHNLGKMGVMQPSLVNPCCPDLIVSQVQYSDYELNTTSATGRKVGSVRDYSLTLRNNASKTIISISFGSEPDERTQRVRTRVFYGNPFLPGQERVEHIRGMKPEHGFTIKMVMFDDGTFEGDSQIAQKADAEILGAKAKHSIEAEALRQIAMLPDHQMGPSIEAMKQRLAAEIQDPNQKGLSGEVNAVWTRRGSVVTAELFLKILGEATEAIQQGQFERVRHKLQNTANLLHQRSSLRKIN